ncbi:bacteriohopanetetrol glucosamine biosynthesis glycosyltransferase HpnI [Paraburkholderia phymatum]|uniref:Hopanoid biosynthesis associated glycosyl transferase protein HpnI n=1 Tax=Paraburkholderia phymatum (strain DSM 17167 / CIP 108236 / LMG 21445 / STM815) TaxID=391038 RepID=B2JHM7_PARP8|nr:bacteriohopanetetrol glucosamine biosynthesis glycosyltransferase HpnI [Paraburkholderia phymatum]ACC70369.1 hopanoid biosynthesis associated glycosyl transferase protein HpnI [Paraburkholderia phymatum STM815]
MQDALLHIYWLPMVLAFGAALYAVVAVLASRVSVSRAAASEGRAAPTPVSVLKPLCGAEPRLFDNLATFCEQTHPCFEVICGVSRADDPAIAIVHRLQAAYPRCRISLVVDPRIHGTNLKVSNLINLAQWAHHDVFVLADSDIAVEPDYLERVCAPLADPQAGVVTCLYRAKGIAGFWSRVGAQFINEWFVPSVRIAHAFGSTRFGFGATLALRRATLERMGGFERLSNTLADDFWLAEHVRELGLATVLSPVVVETDVTESTLSALWDRETRWLRTIRSVNRLGFAFLFVTITLPWIVCGAWLAFALHGAALHPAALAALVGACVTGLSARVILHAMMSGERHMFWRDLALMPVRDALLFAQWMAGSFGSTVVWRGVRMPVEDTGAPATVFRPEPVKALEVSDGR